VGQEVYGAGLPFGIISRQYFKLKELDAMVFINYPTSNFRMSKKSVTFHLCGDTELKAQLQLIGVSKSVQSKIKVEEKIKSTYAPIESKSSNQYEISGGSKIRITWSTL
jgi:hypothetical protein